MVSALLFVGGLIICGNSCHFITFHVFAGALQLITHPYTVHTFDNKHRSTAALCFLHFVIIALFSLSFIHAQIIRAWVKCMRPWNMQPNMFTLFWRCPRFTAAKHQRALWTAIIGSMGLFVVLLSRTIVACIKTDLHTQIVTVRILNTPSSSYATYMLHSSRLP